MRIIICGGRDYHLTPADIARLDVLYALHPIVEVIHGGASGADSDADVWAKSRGIPCRSFPVSPADWSKRGKAAGPIRNTTMLRYLQCSVPGGTHMVIAFPGGRGTADVTDSR